MNEEYRRSRRRQMQETVSVVDAMTGLTVGRIGNLSAHGMLLIANNRLVDDALYQVRFRLRQSDGNELACELGVHVLWSDENDPNGMVWTGLRFLAVPEAQAEAIRVWSDGNDDEIPSGSEDDVEILPFTLPFGAGND